MQGQTGLVVESVPVLSVQDCNGKMVECPQCGHSLMNARNRTAELLAAKLNQLRGDTVKTVMASQALNITVNCPQKVGKGLFSYITYRWVISGSGLI